MPDLNAGRQLWHFAGHGATTLFGSTFSTSNISQLTNTTKPFIVNSMACDCGDFDEGDCLGELLVTDANGAVSTATNARFGWGAPPEMGPSEALCMEFYNNYVKGFNQGEANNLAKDFWRMGSRIAPQTTNVSMNSKHKNVIVVNYADRNPGEPMTTRPSLGKSAYLKLDAETMQWGIVVADFEGESR